MCIGILRLSNLGHAPNINPLARAPPEYRQHRNPEFEAHRTPLQFRGPSISTDRDLFYVRFHCKTLRGKVVKGLGYDSHIERRVVAGDRVRSKSPYRYRFEPRYRRSRSAAVIAGMVSIRNRHIDDQMAVGIIYRYAVRYHRYIGDTWPVLDRCLSAKSAILDHQYGLY